jgi:hypothetical protein
MGGVGFADSSRSLTQSAGGATEVGSSSTGPLSARAGVLGAEHWPGAEQCWAWQWEHSCDPCAETALTVAADAPSVAVAQCSRDWASVPARGVHQPLAAIASRGATVRYRTRRSMAPSYPTPLFHATGAIAEKQSPLACVDLAEG